ncbi:MAG: DUF4395 domain-containing protein [Actinomycetota bacterium]|nr:MAG: DUF4395 domain-containing protein [Actinomycetota bacterium]
MKVDPRGQRFVAAVTAVVLAAVLLTLTTPVGVVLLAVQTVAFAIAVAGGVRRHPYAVLYARLVRPRLGPPAELEDARPPRFAQGLGLVFVAAGLVGLLAGATVVAAVAVAAALAAALLNAVFGLCLGCELYLIGLRVRHPAVR